MALDVNIESLQASINAYAQELGFAQCGFATTDLAQHIEHYRGWLERQFHGDMHYMQERLALRSDPSQLMPNTLSVISVRLNYVPKPAGFCASLSDPNKANVSRYALGRDYHKMMRKKLALLGQKIRELGYSLNYRAFVDSAPVLERAFAEQAGLGWIGKNTMLINPDQGSFFFLGELFTDLPLTPETSVPNQCGQCNACIKLCPTGAIVAPYQLDARKCISYLTIEHLGAIPLELRPLMGNRIYGCDDCQLVCPFNRGASATDESDFAPRHGLDDASLQQLFNWTEAEFLQRFEGSPIRRIGYLRWLRNIAVALGNAPGSIATLEALNHKRRSVSADLVLEHIDWAIAQQEKRLAAPMTFQFNADKLIRTANKIVGHLN
ncbi:MAG: tRNA epoxyqueuosine(34) reductase QueG [Gammaproteobacteria bacterium]|nr:tRNA epoxyqueuosine(34) reductase QueG [Gammaproteobacteria bacterium]